ncbi:hypothetical protein FSW04_05835 [Baekduia soli]|uniref:Uncharacterized protein n=1 Tax=Baekduia soli TaxID=496014 RepID=A0A5B8U2B5_9ACTN|nr:hypothetical protein [Baekduia soli]QEC47157.1 hypothetical protein FSW04_05835 [Baekduia soli]
MTWGFLWLMLALKIPVGALLYLVWWAIHQDVEPDDGDSGGDGGSKVPPDHRGGRDRFPRRRGPHGDPAPVPPARVRTAARARDPEHH